MTSATAVLRASRRGQACQRLAVRALTAAVVAVTGWGVLRPAAAETLYVTSQEAGEVAFIDTLSGLRHAIVQVGDAPAGVAVSPDGSRVYVSHPDAGQITVIDAASASVVARWALGGMPFGMVVAADGRALYVTDWRRHALLRLDADTGQELAMVAVGRAPAGVAFDAGCRRLFVADREGGTVTVVDAVSMQRIAQVPVGDRPFAVVVHGERVYVANVKSRDITVMDAASLAVEARVALGGMPYGVAADARDGRIWVTEQQSGTLVGMAAGAGIERGKAGNAEGVAGPPSTTAVRVKVGKYPEGLAIVGGKAYVANWFDDAVAVVDLASARVDERIKTGAGPRMTAIAQACTTSVVNAR